MKNQDNVLPLSAADLDSTAFIGPTGGILVSIGMSGEKAMGLPDHQVGPVPSIEKIAGKKVVYAVANDFDGKPIPAANLSNLVRTNAAGNSDPERFADRFHDANGKALPLEPLTHGRGRSTFRPTALTCWPCPTRGTTGSVTLDGAPGAWWRRWPWIRRRRGGRSSAGRDSARAAARRRGHAQRPRAGSGARRPGRTALASLPGLKGQHPISSNIIPTADHLNNARNRIVSKRARTI